MANHNLPALAGTTYADFLSQISARLTDVAQGLDPAVTTVTNPPPNAIRWTSAANRWEKWNGTAWVVLSTGYAINLAGPSTVTANASGAALTITQTGSGPALVVEDEAGDATPFVIDAAGRVINGHTQSLNIGGSQQPEQVYGAGLSLGRFEDSAFGADIRFYKSRSATIGGLGILQSGDALGNVNFFGDDGAAVLRNVMAASVRGAVDGAPAAGSVPGRLVFSTTQAGSGGPAERMRIDSDGRISFGGAPFGNSHFFIHGSAFSSDTTSYGVRNYLEMPAVATSLMVPFGSTARSVSSDTPYTTANLYHFWASSFAPGANHTVTNQAGFVAGSGLTSAANNFGFRSELAAAAGRWNFYAAGTAPNYFAGDLRTSTVVTQATVPTALNTSATLTASTLLQGIRSGTPTAAITYTLPTGANMDLAFASLENNMSFEWSVINLAAVTHTITLAANTGHTVVGAMVVQPATSGRFLTRKTAADTFITYRIA